MVQAAKPSQNVKGRKTKGVKQPVVKVGKSPKPKNL